MERTDILKVITKEKNIRKKMLDYLEDSDLKRLSDTSKRAKKVLKAYHKQVRSEEPQNLKEFIKQKFAREKKKIKGNVMKTTIFDIKSKFVAPFDWLCLNKTEEENLELVDVLQGIVPLKLLKDYSHFIFFSKEADIYLILNRALVDSRMELFFKLNERDRNREDVTETDSTHYKILQEDEELKIENFKGVPNGMKLRQEIYYQKLNDIKNKEQVEQEKADNKELIAALDARKMAMILCEGGSFSVGIFEGIKEIIHKSDKKYVIRKKQGTRQLLKDKGKSGIQSVGSQMRRNNEILHQENVTQILSSLETNIEDADFTLVYAPGINRTILFDQGRALFEYRKSKNMRSVGLPSKKANYTELLRIYKEVIKVYIVAHDDFGEA